MNESVVLTDRAYSGDLLAFSGGASQTYTGEAVNGTLSLGAVDVPSPRTWSTTDPQLHTVEVGLNGATVTERFGLRQVGVDAATSCRRAMF